MLKNDPKSDRDFQNPRSFKSEDERRTPEIGNQEAVEMQVSFKNAESAVLFGAPTLEEQRAMAEVTKGNIREAEAILDQVVAKDPSRILNIRAYAEPGVSSFLRSRYHLEDVGAEMPISAPSSPPLQLDAGSRLAPPAYGRSEQVINVSSVKPILAKQRKNLVVNLPTYSEIIDQETEASKRKSK